MDIETREQLLERFRAYLDELPDAALAEPGEENRQTDLYSLFAELAALKTEVRLESRQVKTAFDEFRAVFETLQASQSQLGGELDRARAALPEQRRAALKPVLLELVELELRELLTKQGFPGDTTPIVRGSAKEALDSTSTDPNAPI